MNPTLVLATSAVLLGIAAVGGLWMAGIRFGRKRSPPPGLAMAHGVLAASAITLLLFAAATDGLPALAVAALVVLLLAAIGGSVLNLRYHWKGAELPAWLVTTHGVLATFGYLMLLATLWAVQWS